MRRLDTSRAALFEAVEKPALKPLPAEPYVYAEWKLRRIGLDYHVEIDRRFYSAPFRYLREQVDVRITERTVEIFFKGERIAAHPRHIGAGGQTTQPDHMPPNHRAFAGWTAIRAARGGQAFTDADVDFRLDIDAQDTLRAVEQSTGVAALFGSYPLPPIM